MKTQKKKEVEFDMYPVWDNLMPLFKLGEQLEKESEITPDGLFKDHAVARKTIEQFLEIRTKGESTHIAMAIEAGITRALLLSVMCGDSVQSVIAHIMREIEKGGK